MINNQNILIFDFGYKLHLFASFSNLSICIYITIFKLVSFCLKCLSINLFLLFFFLYILTFSFTFSPIKL